ncbi:MAG: UDP-N-acetylglucosamine 2-epimerase (non-hydrolyzing) [Desulfomonile tiedjei]|uniref:UDP-N-acetylglucosamine 2-epimerase (non-hydrolyzing) n=1 Tax=Desulfomonile tiedjei TaxID=2358 RepID=A0A9D6Z2J9_9BACT|nr:UDP-N-acetylglucosamine 2-epimerase (non-hydrolyzing) [Desulfomonile tiedjei]
MTRLKCLSIVGTRPEAIKMAPVIHELERHAGVVESMVCSTGQHNEMLGQMLRLFGISSDCDLDVMRPNQTLSELTSRIITSLDSFVSRQQPDWIVVQGDTTTVMAAALVAFYHRIKVAHVEAGLRTWDKFQPFPEEINRKVADAISDMHFAPTLAAKNNLMREGISESSIFVTGNTVIDAALLALHQDYSWVQGPLRGIPMDKRLILVTAHRRENHGEGIKGICRALKEIASERIEDVHIVYPVHLNPNIMQPVETYLGGIENISLTPPLDYFSLVNLMSLSYLVLTDSGGIQEEAPSLGKPVLVMRDKTERPEGVEAGTARLVGTNPDRIIKEATKLLDNPTEYEAMARAVNPYGDGQASRRIVEALLGGRPEEFLPKD